MRLTTMLCTVTLTLGVANGAVAQATPCCEIVGIDARTGLVTAKVTASNASFQFRAVTPQAARHLRPGQKVYANFTTNQVSLDGRKACCTITRPPQASVGIRPPVRQQPKTPGAANAAANVAVNTDILALPRVTYGEPIPVERGSKGKGPSLQRVEVVNVAARVGGRAQTSEVVLVRGLDGIEKATMLPRSARKVMEMHVRTLRPGQSTNYIVNPGAAREWFATHPLPDSAVEVPPIHLTMGSMSGSSMSALADQMRRWAEQHPEAASGGGGGSDCGNMFESMDCFNETVQDAGEGFTEGWEQMWEAANDAWTKKTEELADMWEVTQECFADKPLPGGSAPVKFAHTASIPVSLEQSQSKGGASGTVTGTVRLDIPVEADFDARMDFFYIPCLPFLVRPRSLSANGTMTIGQEFSVGVDAAGSFQRRIKIPPTGGPQIPIQIIPVVIGGVPVAILDISAYIEGVVDIASEGTAKGTFTLTNSQKSTFDFTCDGDGCSGNEKGTTAPATTKETAQIQGQVTVSPGLYTALQLNLNYNVLGARAGPLPYLKGMASGCAAITSTQTAGDASSATETNEALTADLDWAIRVRAEALAGGKVIGKSWEKDLMKDPKHIWFKDLAGGGSSALKPAVTAPATAVATQRTDIRVRMPSCFPYPDKVQYRISWTGNATPTNAACQWNAASRAGTCWFDPTKDLPFSLTWTTAGTYSVSVSLVKDDHRNFGSTRLTQHTVTVSTPGGGS